MRRVIGVLSQEGDSVALSLETRTSLITEWVLSQEGDSVDVVGTLHLV